MKTAVTPTRAENFPEWYQNVIKVADMAENSPVRGCMIMKPVGYAIWERIQRELDDMIKDCGVENAYFPLLIPLSYLSKEAEHVDGFATECAVVTHHRLEKGEDGGLVPAAPLQEPLIVRPTSETIIGEAISKWIQSYRDLPLKLNQWGNVMRWEMRPRLFLRTSEFLWQEGHNCFETKEEARQDSLHMLDVYRDCIEDLLAIPVIRGEKTADERFPGAIATFTIEAMMQDGKALQAGTSHDLGQTFSKSAEIKFQSKDGEEKFAWTTSWGFSTRTIGAMIMVHADDDGVVVPPRIAPKQVVIMPVQKKEENKDVTGYCERLASALKEKGVRVTVDTRDLRNSDKMWDAIKKGIPLRVEAGEREMAEQKFTVTRRDIGRDSKVEMSFDKCVDAIPELLETMHHDMFNKAKSFMDANIHEVSSVAEIKAFFDAGKIGFVHAPVSVLDDPELEAVKKDHALTPRCLPYDDAGEKVIIGKSY